MSCRPIVFQMNLAEPTTLNTRPMFQALMNGSQEERLTAYRDPAWRARAYEELNSGRAFRWHKVTVAESSMRRDLINRPLVDLAEEWGGTPLDAMLDLSIDDDLETRFWTTLANDDKDTVGWLLPRDNVLLGLADSGAHVSQLCDACFATDLLGQWCASGASCPSSELFINSPASQPGSTV